MLALLTVKGSEIPTLQNQESQEERSQDIVQT